MVTKTIREYYKISIKQITRSDLSNRYRDHRLKIKYLVIPTIRHHKFNF